MPRIKYIEPQGTIHFLHRIPRLPIRLTLRPFRRLYVNNSFRPWPGSTFAGIVARNGRKVPFHRWCGKVPFLRPLVGKPYDCPIIGHT